MSNQPFIKLPPFKPEIIILPSEFSYTRRAKPAYGMSGVVKTLGAAYRVFLPYKPSRYAEGGFHQAGMVWVSHGPEDTDIDWAIPADKLDAALELICYWYGENPQPGFPPYTVRVKTPEQFMEAA